MNKVSLYIFYLLTLLLPTQLGRHFFFDFSLILGIRSDYLVPTIYFTDILIFLIVFSWVLKTKNKLRQKICKNKPCFWLVAYFFTYLLVNSIFIAQNKPVAIYKTAKIIEFTLLGLFIIDVKPNKKKIFTLFTLAGIYQAIIAIFQFINQGSLGGLLWWLGERSFYVSTPGIARFSYLGELFLRPYATLPHPNVLGGFLSIVLTIVLYYLFINQFKSRFITVVFYLSLILCFIALILTLSRSAYFSCIIGVLFMLLAKFYRPVVVQTKLRKHTKLILSIFYLSFLLSIAIFLLTPFKQQSLVERSKLIKIAISLLSARQLFGIGLNNFIFHLSETSSKGQDLFIFQPVHNIYLLTLVELGIMGFFSFLLLLTVILRQALKNSFLITVLMIQLYLLGLFDHYIFTLQQGMLLFIVIASIAFLPKDS